VSTAYFSGDGFPMRHEGVGGVAGEEAEGAAGDGVHEGRALTIEADDVPQGGAVCHVRQRRHLEQRRPRQVEGEGLPVAGLEGEEAVVVRHQGRGVRRKHEGEGRRPQRPLQHQGARQPLAEEGAGHVEVDACHQGALVDGQGRLRHRKVDHDGGGATPAIRLHDGREKK